jgi:glucosylceramidase
MIALSVLGPDRQNFALLRPFIAAIAVSGAAFVAAPQASAQEVTLYRSSKAGDRLTRLPAASFAEGAAPAAPHFTINDAALDQRMIGFGASFNEAGMISLNSLDPAAQEKVLEALFDAQKGAGFSAMKTVIGATDFMSAGPFYSYNETPGDVEMKNFSIARDLEPDGLVPFIKRSQKYGRFILQATMDYPPNWMLMDLHANQDVNEKYYDALSLYFLRYLQEYKKQGIAIDFLSPFNEPMGYIAPRFLTRRCRPRLPGC